MCENSSDWPSLLQAAVSTINKTSFAGTNVTPFEMMYRFAPRDAISHQLQLPEFTEFPMPGDDVSPDIEAALHSRELRKTRARTAANLKRSLPPAQPVGALVWVFNHPDFDLVNRSRDLKLQPKWLGPYVVLKSSSLTSYRLRPLGGEIVLHSHVQHIQPFLNAAGLPLLLDPTSATHTVDKPNTKGVATQLYHHIEGERWQVVAVLDHHLQEGVLSFLLQWEAYPTPTWAKELSLDCPALVQAYFAHLKRVSSGIATVAGTPVPE
jgi:hypothetical protein